MYRIALSYERGYKYAKSYGLVTGGGTSGTGKAKQSGKTGSGTNPKSVGYGS